MDAHSTRPDAIPFISLFDECVNGCSESILFSVFVQFDILSVNQRYLYRIDDMQ